MFEIIKNAELPPKARGSGRPIIYPFPQMEVGDGFDAPDDMGGKVNGASRRRDLLGSAARFWAKHHNPSAKFATRVMSETGMVRCVRIV